MAQSLRFVITSFYSLFDLSSNIFFLDARVYFYWDLTKNIESTEVLEGVLGRWLDQRW